MYNIKDSKPITLTKGKITITLDLGIGSYNPDESKLRKLTTNTVFNCKPWLKYENIWYLLAYAWRYNSLKDIAAYFKKDCYTEEMFLEKIIEHIQ